MEIPKNIEKLINDRVKAVEKFDKADGLLTYWICKNGLADDIDSYDFAGGVESIVHPRESAERIRQAILAK